MIKFLRNIPGYYRLYKNEYDPELIRFIINSYREVVSTCTGGKLSKVTYYPYVVIEEIRHFYEDEDTTWTRESSEP